MILVSSNDKYRYRILHTCTTASWGWGPVMFKGFASVLSEPVGAGFSARRRSRFCFESAVDPIEIKVVVYTILPAAGRHCTFHLLEKLFSWLGTGTYGALNSDVYVYLNLKPFFVL